jgi:predicted aspartyl protease
LIELDGSEAEEGTVLAAHKDPELVDKELEKYSQLKMIHLRPLYVTYSIPEGQELPVFAL